MIWPSEGPAKAAALKVVSNMPAIQDVILLIPLTSVK